MAVTHDDILHNASAIDQHRDLPPDFMGQTRAKTRQLPGDDGILRDSPAIDMLKATKLTGFQAGEITVWRGNMSFSLPGAFIAEIPVCLGFTGQPGGLTVAKQS